MQLGCGSEFSPGRAVLIVHLQSWRKQKQNENSERTFLIVYQGFLVILKMLFTICQDLGRGLQIVSEI